jgi:hypothetical protein
VASWIILLAFPAMSEEADPNSYSHSHRHSHRPRPDDHAPIGVMGDHMHKKGELMLSYRYMFMNMNGNRSGTDRIGTDAVNASFPVAPFDMDMEMHMLGLMWAPSDHITLMAMLPFVELDMQHRTRTGGGFETETSGIGDIRLSGLLSLAQWDGAVFGSEAKHRIHANLGVSLPTGSVDLKDQTPMGRVRLPYPMQIGSGTYDLLPGLLYKGSTERYSWGAQLRSNLRTGRNSKGYHLGHRVGGTAWLARRWSEAVSTSLRIDVQDWGNIRGDDDSLNPNLVPTADPDRRGGRRVDLLAGVNFLINRGPLRNHRIAAEVGWPVYQDLDGPQLETDWSAMIGWQRAF